MGGDSHGQLGVGDTEDRHSLTQVGFPDGVAADFRFASVSVGSDFAVALGSDGHLYSWGDGASGRLGLGAGAPADGVQLKPTAVVMPDGAPSGFRFTSVDAGSDFAVALGSDSRLYAWGDGASGRLGVSGGSAVQAQPEPVVLPAGAPSGFHFTDFSAGTDHVLALGSDGLLYAWGADDSGQIGDDASGAGTARSVPIPVKQPAEASPDFRFAAVSAGSDYSLALGSDGRLYAWGKNGGGRLGDGTDADWSVPVAANMPSGVTFTAISAGGNRSLALGSDGQVYACGGAGNVAADASAAAKQASFAPVRAASGMSFTQVAAGAGVSPDGELYAALGSDGHAYTWGSNGHGQLGDGTASAADRSAPGMVPDPRSVDCARFDGEHVDAVSAGSGAWTVTTPRHEQGAVPVEVPLLDGETVKLSYTYTGTQASPVNAGADASTGVGAPEVQAQDRSEKDDSQPVSGLGTRSVETRSVSDTLSPASGPAVGKTKVTAGVTQFVPTAVGAGYDFSLAFGTDGRLYAWGNNAYGRLGVGDMTNRSVPTPVKLPAGAPAGFRYTKFSARGEFTLAMGSNNRLYAWGANGSGQLGNGHSGSGVDSSTPVPVNLPAGVSPSSFRFTDFSSGSDFSLAMGNNNQLYAWGYGHWGQLGQGNTDNKTVPVPVAPPKGAVNFRYTRFDTGRDFVLAQGSNNHMYGWGYNSDGATGDGTGGDVNVTNIRTLPVLTKMPTGVTFKDFSAGGWHCVALGSDGRMYTWGNNWRGQLGNGIVAGIGNGGGILHQPKAISTPAGVTFKKVSAGGVHSLALTSDGRLYAWGQNDSGRLGDRTTTTRANLTPVRMPTGVTFTDMTAGLSVPTVTGDGISIALGSNSRVYTWGGNVYGQLGDKSIPPSGRYAPGGTTDPRVVTSVTFDGSAGTGLSSLGGGKWSVSSPAHAPGAVTAHVGLVDGETLSFPYTYTVQIRFDSNGSSAVAAQTVSTATGKVTAPADPVRSGLMFVGWYQGASPWNFATHPVKDTTLTAHWARMSLSPMRSAEAGGPVALTLREDNTGGSASYTPASSSALSAVSLKMGDGTVVQAPLAGATTLAGVSTWRFTMPVHTAGKVPVSASYQLYGGGSKSASLGQYLYYAVVTTLPLTGGAPGTLFIVPATALLVAAIALLQWRRWRYRV